MVWTIGATRVASVVLLFLSLIPWESFSLLLSLISSFLSLAVQRVREGTWDGAGTLSSDNLAALLPLLQSALQSIIQEHNITTLEELSETITNKAVVEGSKHTHVQQEQILNEMNELYVLVQTIVRVVPWIMGLIMAGSIITCCAPATLDDDMHPHRRTRKKLIDENLIPYIPHPKVIPDPDDLCSICWEPLYGAPQAQSATCRHHFHRTCVSAWLMHGTQCPSCRQPYLNRRTTIRIERLDHGNGTQ